MDLDESHQNKTKAKNHLSCGMHHKDSVALLVVETGPVSFPSFRLSSNITLHINYTPILNNFRDSQKRHHLQGYPKMSATINAKTLSHCELK